MGPDVDILGGTIRHDEPVLQIHVSSVPPRALRGLLHPGEIVRMNPRQYELQRGPHPRVIPDDAKGLRGPIELTARDGPAETAGEAEALGFLQVSFAAPQLLL